MSIKVSQVETEKDPNQTSLIGVNQLLLTNKPIIINVLREIDSFLGFLLQDAEYVKGNNNSALITGYKRKFLELSTLIQKSTMQIKTSQLVMIPPAPSPDFENASKTYIGLQQAISKLQQFLNTFLRSLNTGVDILDQAISANKDWVKEWQAILPTWKDILVTSWELQLTTTKYASLKLAYPLMEPLKPTKSNVDLKKWKDTAAQMTSFSRVYGSSYTFPQILYHFTKEWDMFERYNFKKWYRWSNMNKKAELNLKLTKLAAPDLLAQDRLSQFTAKKKKLISRVGLTRKALHELINSGLIDQNAADKIYKIISMLELETMRLQVPKIASARVMRASKQLNKLGFMEGADILALASREFLDTTLVKTAEGADPKEAVALLRDLKKEMDALSYGRHLDTLYGIMQKLKMMGRSSDVEAIEKVIRDDLGTLEKLNKKLTEVYTSLSKVPLELSEEEDFSAPKEKSREMPIKVEEKEKTPALEPAPKEQVKVERPTVAPPRGAPIAPKKSLRDKLREKSELQQRAPQPPKIDTSVPNV